jgi:elongator complex protein 3
VNERERWTAARRYTPEALATAEAILAEVRAGRDVTTAVRRHPLPGRGHVGKHVLVAAYERQVAAGAWPPDPNLLALIRMKPVRTLSGVTTVTILTKPYPCPGACIFCPDDVRLPKSYLADEPGARRGLEHNFDPYAQVAARLQALRAVGHPTNKVELLILGGTWSAYRRDYQEWFVRRAFEALNEYGPDEESASLPAAQLENETAAHRCVGLAIETRPDRVTLAELDWLRYLGVTKVQLGAQSLDDEILRLNGRGHTAAATRRATDLLRLAGFKIVLHWMPNLLGATPASDRADFGRLWEGFCPDELKIYPTQLLAGTELYTRWQAGGYSPYDTATLVDLIADIKLTIPPYCRVNRVIRDIPSTYVAAGNKRTSLRQDAQAELARRGQACQCLRCREVRGQAVTLADLQPQDVVYHTGVTEEHFLSLVTNDDKVAGFLRLALPRHDEAAAALPDLAGAAIIREVHVYGQSLVVGEEAAGAAQHGGLGTRLLGWAEELARTAGFGRLAVISAVGVRGYYLGRGFDRGARYLVKPL